VRNFSSVPRITHYRDSTTTESFSIDYKSVLCLVGCSKRSIGMLYYQKFEVKLFPGSTNNETRRKIYFSLTFVCVRARLSERLIVSRSVGAKMFVRGYYFVKVERHERNCTSETVRYQNERVSTRTSPNPIFLELIFRVTFFSEVQICLTWVENNLIEKSLQTLYLE